MPIFNTSQKKFAKGLKALTSAILEVNLIIFFCTHFSKDSKNMNDSSSFIKKMTKTVQIAERITLRLKSKSHIKKFN